MALPGFLAMDSVGCPTRHLVLKFPKDTGLFARLCLVPAFLRVKAELKLLLQSENISCGELAESLT
jgi:hypothetical protein